MTTEPCGRAISPTFMSDLRNGMLSQLLARVHSDRSLQMELRGRYLNVYYRGGNILRVEANGTGYEVFFDLKYATAPLQLPQDHVTTVSEVQAWLDCLPLLKNTMDIWFGSHPKDERGVQQMVVYENNCSSWANGTDYFIVDIEYDNRHGARFDLVALRWDSDAAARKLQGGYLPILAAIELKVGDGALSGNAGMVEHCRQWEDCFSDAAQVTAFKQEMLEVFRQKRELGLIPALDHNRNAVTNVAAEIEVMFLVANHDPSSRKLAAAVNAIRDRRKVHSPGVQVRFATAAFMGFGLYAQNVLPIDDFLRQVERAARRQDE